MGETENGLKRLDFDAHLRLEFRGAKVTTDAGLLAVRELDEVLGLTEMAAGMLAEGRANNRRHDLTGLFRQSVYARLAGYEDVNDQEAPGHGLLGIPGAQKPGRLGLQRAFQIRLLPG